MAFGLIAASVAPLSAQTDFSTVTTGITSEVGAIATAALGAAVIGLSIFAVRFGVRVIKGAVKAGS